MTRHELRRVLEAMTEGPLEVFKVTPYGYTIAQRDKKRFAICDVPKTHLNDAAGIVALRNHAAAVLDLLEEARAYIEGGKTFAEAMGHSTRVEESLLARIDGELKGTP